MSEPRQVETLDELRKLVGKKVYASTGDTEDGDYDFARGELLEVEDGGNFCVRDDSGGGDAWFLLDRSYVVEASDE